MLNLSTNRVEFYNGDRKDKEEKGLASRLSVIKKKKNVFKHHLKSFMDFFDMWLRHYPFLGRDWFYCIKRYYATGG
jgi:hypothetical protein